MLIARSVEVKGMRHVRGVMSVPSLNLRQRGRAEWSRENMKIAAELAALRAQRRVLTARRRCEGGRYG